MSVWPPGTGSLPQSGRAASSLTIRVFLGGVRDEPAVVRAWRFLIWDPVIVVVIVTFIAQPVVVCVQLGAVGHRRAVVPRVLVTVPVAGGENDRSGLKISMQCFSRSWDPHQGSTWGFQPGELLKLIVTQIIDEKYSGQTATGRFFWDLKEIPLPLSSVFYGLRLSQVARALPNMHLFPPPSPGFHGT